MLPDGSKSIAFSASGYNPISETTTGTFARSAGTCCATSTVPMTASYSSPELTGSDLFSDYGVFPRYLCCSGTEHRFGQMTLKLQLASSFAYRFRLRLCSLQVTVCQKLIGYECGLEIKVKAIFGRKVNGDAFQACQSKTRFEEDGFWVCESGVPVKVAGSATIDTTEFSNNCCCTGVGCGGSATDFVASPPELTTTLPAAFDCAYAAGFPTVYVSSNGAEYFHIERTAFLPGVTELPATPITFTPTGQSLVQAPAAWIVNQVAYEAASDTTTGSPNSCGRSQCDTNFGKNAGVAVMPYCGTAGIGVCIEGRNRTVSQARNLSLGTHFFDPMADSWEISII